MWAGRGGLRWVSSSEPVTLRTPLGSLPRNCAKCTLVQLYYCRGPQSVISSAIYFTLYILITYRLNHQRLEDEDRLTMAGIVKGFVYFIGAGDGRDTVTTTHAWIVERHRLFIYYSKNTSFSLFFITPKFSPRQFWHVQ